MATTTAKKQTAYVQPTHRTMPITDDDSKVLGRTMAKRLEKSVPPQKFQTRMYKTVASAWTPVVHKPSNEQIYKERRNLIMNWFDLWSDSQRKRFLDMLFRSCKKSQMYFIQQWFNDRVPLKYVDFTKVLPRFLSLYILSFLDPRSLSRASMVCWQWKFLTEQDVLWRPKAMRRGWYLPYTPADNEYGAWKRHYVACTQTIDMDVLAKNKSSLYGTMGDGSQKKKREKPKLSLTASQEVLEARPPWMPTDKAPRDTALAAKALLEDYNPNDPQVSASLTLHHNRWGIIKSASRLRHSAPVYGLQNTKRKGVHRTLESDDDPALRPQHQKSLMSGSMQLESFEERRMMELVRQPWEPELPQKMSTARRPNLSGGGDYPLPWKHNTRQSVSKSYPHQANPRVVFISSRVPAADVLVDAVLFGVIPLVYEYEGTTLESLMSRLDLCLQGRNAQSIGIFVHSELPWELPLVHGSTVTLDTLDNGEFVQFFETIANFVLPSEKDGHVDIFAPLASCEPGMEMLIQLRNQTGMCFSSPTGIVGNYNHVNSEWLSTPEHASPPSHYFCSSKMNVWANTADQVKEACQVTKNVVGRYFEQTHRDVVAQLVGQLVFDATGQVTIQGTEEVTRALVEGLQRLGEAQNAKSDREEGSEAAAACVQNPVEYLGQYLVESSPQFERTNTARARHKGKSSPRGTLAPAATLAPQALSTQLGLDERFDDSLPNSEYTDEVDSEVADINTTGDKHAKNQRNKVKQDTRPPSDGDSIPEVMDEVVDQDEDEDIPEDLPESGEDRDGQDEDGEQWGSAKKKKTKKQQKIQAPKPQKSKSPTNVRMSTAQSRSLQLSLKDSGAWTDTLKAYSSVQGPARTTRGLGTLSSSRAPPQLTAEQLKAHPEKHAPIAQEVLASELNYMRTLEIFETVFLIPLKSALDSNRAVLSAHNLQIIFTDPITLLQLSKGLVQDLKQRLADWGPQQCLGDVFLKFTANFKAYVNFLNNYPTILTTIERCAEQAPLFRAFLNRHQRTPQTKMLTLSELLLVPTRRIKEYVTLLTWFLAATPPDHADRIDLRLAIEKYGELDDLIMECKQRSEREKELAELQKRIINSPIILEANRFFIGQLDVAHLKPPAKSVVPELRVYQHIETLGLFLFNDGLVVTRRTTKHFPFERSLELNYRFDACIALTRLRVEDLPDSKYVRNAFRLFTPRRSWTCKADGYDDKFNWITLVEETIRAAVED